MPTPHKHAAQIKAWADGATIEYENAPGDWLVSNHPSWDPFTEYRIKPEPKPNVVTWHAVQNTGIESSEYTRQDAADYIAVTSILRIEINHNNPANPVLVSATLEKP